MRRRQRRLLRPAEVAETEAVSKEPAEVAEVSIKSEEEAKPFPDPPSVEVSEDEKDHLVYAWQYSDDEKYAKIGISTKIRLSDRMPKTYHPTDTTELIGIFKCANHSHTKKVEEYILSKLKRTLRDREWVEIDEAVNKMIDETFISAPNVLFKIFGTQIKIKKS